MMLHSESMSEKVLVHRYQMEADGDLLQITLNKPKALNALDLDMIRQLQRELNDAKTDDSVKIIFLDAAGDKAFCAGGDIVGIYNAINASKHNDAGELDEAPEFLQQFFTEEYTLDFTIHNFSKPIIAWGHGIIMGGGMGIYEGATYRIVTEKTRIAMPELAIGLIPDVGASFFLNKLPEGIGLFLGLTGLKLNASDAVQFGLADICIEHEKKNEVIASLLAMPHADKESIKLLLTKFQHVSNETASTLGEHQHELAELNKSSDIKDAQKWIRNYADRHAENPYFKNTTKAVNSASPLSSLLFFEQLKRGQDLNLAECFAMELALSLSCVCSGELEEGIRALLIDKDNTPVWRFENVDLVPVDFLKDQFNYFEKRNLQNPLLNLTSIGK